MSEKVICQHVEYHDDMYPEFAPRPIVVACTDEAVVVWSDDGVEEFGEGPGEQVMCIQHAYLRMCHYAGSQTSWGMYSLMPDHRELYLAGKHHAEAVELTEQAALVASYEGIEEAGLLPAVEWADPWMLGYTDEIERRIAAMVQEEGLR